MFYSKSIEWEEIIVVQIVVQKDGAQLQFRRPLDIRARTPYVE